MNSWIRIIHVAKTQCGLDDEAYRALLEGAAGVSSSKEIRTVEQFNSVMLCFQRIGFKSEQQLVKHQWGCTAAQKEKIQKLWSLVARNPTEEALLAFMFRITHVEALEWINERLAQKVIIALEAMAAQKGSRESVAHGVAE